MYTSCVALVCSLFATGSAPVWHRSYGQALEAGQRFGLPVAIFVAAGDDADQILHKGEMSNEIRKVLAEQYVCVVLDPARDHDLVETLLITKKAGLVIGDRTGSLQAFHHDGKINQQDLARRLQQFADPTVVVRTTQTNATVQRVSFYPNGGSTGAGQPIRIVNC